MYQIIAWPYLFEHFVFRVYPVIVSNSNCDHTFCALCLLKHFFSRLDEDEYWNTQLIWPTCQAVLSLILDDTSQLSHSCPFISNTATDKCMMQLMDSLHQYTFNEPGSPKEIVKWLINGDLRVTWWTWASIHIAPPSVYYVSANTIFRYSKFIVDSVVKD